MLLFDGNGARRHICVCPIWDLPFVPARYDMVMEFRGRLLARPPGLSQIGTPAPCAGVTAHARPAPRPPP
eukprot:2334891-Prymnesium_polylepis.1